MTDPTNLVPDQPQVLIDRSRLTLAAAIDLLEQADRLCHYSNDLTITVETLLGGIDGDDDEGCAMAQEWSKTSGQWEISLVLTAVAARINNAMGSSGSCYRDENASDLRRRFSDLLEPPDA